MCNRDAVWYHQRNRFVCYKEINLIYHSYKRTEQEKFFLASLQLNISIVLHLKVVQSYKLNVFVFVLNIDCSYFLNIYKYAVFLSCMLSFETKESIFISLNDRHCQYFLTTNDGCGKKVINSTIGKSNLFLSYFHT